MQRWYADDVLNNTGEDRSLRTVFTHDHFGPSTHQHPGLYAGLVVEPANSTWKHNETGTPLSGRADGGPTSWQAIIEPKNGDKAYREFLLEMGDFSLAYRNDETPVNPPAKEEAGLHDLLRVAPTCPGGVPRPCPEAISADDPGTMTVNYRNEPIALRVNNGANGQTPGRAGDLSFAFESLTDRAIPALNSQPDFFAQPLTRDVLPGDPFTPLLKTFAGDKVQVRILMGAHEEGHNFSMHGLKWLFEPSLKDSGYRNSQMLGISEHFEFEVDAVDSVKVGTPFVDQAYFPGAATDDLWNGLWGILRTYN
ncbi:copper oxidase, partial [Methylobacter sp. BlB1]|nr:copper oxidase [Methylobacter sp. BlB1]